MSVIPQTIVPKMNGPAVAALLGCSHATVLTLVRRGILRPLRFGNRYQYLQSEVFEVLNARNASAAAAADVEAVAS